MPEMPDVVGALGADETGVPRLLVLEHDLYSLPGSFADRARGREVDLYEVRTDRVETIPDPRDFDGVVVLGSVYSVFDDDIKPWFDAEVDRIRQADREGVPVLGVCFGAQAVARTLGGEVRRVDRAEIGWTRIESDAPEIVDNGPWFQWHHDVISPPPGATIVARNAFSVQAYTIRNNLAVQFHPEITPEVLQIWLDADASEAEAQGINPADLLTETERCFRERREAAYAFFDRFIDSVMSARNR